MLYPRTDPDPLVGGIIPSNILIVVDFPAPLGPRKPKTEPFGILKLTLSTATKSSNFLVKFSTSTARLL
jgi:hypothetical protein